MARNLWNTGNTTTNVPDDARVMAFGDAATNKTFNFTWASFKTWIKSALNITGTLSNVAYKGQNNNFTTSQSVTGSVTASGDITSNSAIRINTLAGNNRGIFFNRPDNTSEASCLYSTAFASNWIVGLDNVGNNNYNFYSYGTSNNVLNLDYNTGDATFIGDIITNTRLRVNTTLTAAPLVVRTAADDHVLIRTSSGVSLIEAVNNINNSLRPLEFSGSSYKFRTGSVEFAGSVAASRLNLSNIPTSASGLVSGDVWSDGGTLKIVS